MFPTCLPIFPFLQDDANDDPQWSLEQIIVNKFTLNGRVIGEQDVDQMAKTTELVFCVLEKAWAKENCALIDMKIEFGVTTEGNQSSQTH